MAATIQIKDQSGATSYIKVGGGDGSSGNPYVFLHTRDSTQRTVTPHLYTANATISAGALTVSFWNAGSNAVTVDGVSWPAGASWDYPYIGGDTYGSISCTVPSGGSLYAIEVR